MNRTLALLGLALAVAVAPGCSQKEPAQTALNAAESALAAVSDPAQKYVPKQYAAVKAELDAARRDFEDGKYLRAIDEVKDIPGKARELGAAATAARETLAAEIAVEWTRLQGELPDKLAALQARLDELGKARRLPQDLTQEALARIGGAAEIARIAWSEATAAEDAGNREGAVARALESEGLAGELMVELGMVPAPAAD